MFFSTQLRCFLIAISIENSWKSGSSVPLFFKHSPASRTSPSLAHALRFHHPAPSSSDHETRGEGETCLLSIDTAPVVFTADRLAEFSQGSQRVSTNLTRQPMMRFSYFYAFTSFNAQEFQAYRGADVIIPITLPRQCNRLLILAPSGASGNSKLGPWTQNSTRILLYNVKS